LQRPKVCRNLVLDTLSEARMNRLFVSLTLLAPWCGWPSSALAQTNESAAELAPGRFTDADVAIIPNPNKIEVLILRGQMGYGAAEVTDAGIAHLTRLKNLRVLRAGGLGLTDRSLEAIGQLSSLEELALDSNKLAGLELGRLAGLKKLRRLNLDFNALDRKAIHDIVRALPNLTHLSLRNAFPVDDDILEACGTLTGLEELNLPENMNAVTDRGLERLGRLRSLKNFELSNPRRVTDAGLARLFALKTLEDLSLRELKHVTPRGLDGLGGLVRLRKLQLVGVPMDDASVRSLGSLKKVEDLLLWSMPVEPLALEPLGAMRSLRYFRTNVPVSSKAIRSLATLEHLERIADELSEVTDEDLKHLARLPNLRMLYLDSPNVSAASLPTLAKMTSLRTLYVGSKIAIIPEQWTALGRTSLTRCEISLCRPPYTVFHKASGSE
jgi:Leucine-rich repeat (LRR) protein